MSAKNLVLVELYFDNETGFTISKEVYPIRKIGNESKYYEVGSVEEDIHVNPRFINMVRILRLNGLVARFWCEEDKLESLLTGIPTLVIELTVQEISRNTQERVFLNHVSTQIPSLNQIVSNN